MPLVVATNAKRSLKNQSGFSLVEVMVATVVFAIVATALVGVFLQNQRYSYQLGYRSQAVTISLSILEQLRFRQYTEINDVYLDGSSGSIDVTIADPDQSSGYTSLTIPVNVRDGVQVNANWTSASVVVDPDSEAPRLPMRFFLSLKRNRQTSGTKVDLFEIVLLYQWLQGGQSDTDWHTGNVRLVVPNLNPLT